MRMASPETKRVKVAGTRAQGADKTTPPIFSLAALLLLIWAAIRIWRDGSWQTRTHWWFFPFCGFSVLLNPNLLPVIAGLEPQACWNGFRPVIDAGGGMACAPLIGKVGSGLWAAFGHYRNGILLAPITALVMTEAVLGKRTAVDLTPFHAERFGPTRVN